MIRPRNLGLFLVVLLCATVLFGRAPKRETLFDFRHEHRSSRQVTDQEARIVLDAVFGKDKYLTSIGECSQSSRAKAIVPVVQSVAQGAFTDPLARERVYLVSANECFATPNQGTYRLVVINAQGQMAMNETVPEYEIVRAADVNGDGLWEILLVGGRKSSTGELAETARLVSLGGGKLNVFKDFGQVFFDPCAGLSDEKTSVAIFFIPGSTPQFMIEPYIASCFHPKWIRQQ